MASLTVPAEAARRTMKRTYLHGYDRRESIRLQDQAD
jgi:hypothetical protein